QRTREEAHGGAGEPSVFGFVALGDPGPLRQLIEAVAREIVRLDYSVTVVGSEAASAPLEWYSEVERTHDFVLYVGEASAPGWNQWVSRQADRLFRVGRGGRPPPPAWSNGAAPAPLQAQQLVDLILLQPANIQATSGSEAWVDAAEPARLFHLRRA